MSGEAHEPTSLNEALRMLRQHDGEAPEEAMEDQGAGTELEPAGDAAGDAGLEAGNQPGADEAEEDYALPDLGDTAARGPAVDYTESDLDSVRQTLINGAQQMAAQDVNREFEEQGWQRFGMNDITERDEQTGRVRFKNPEDPNRDFSSRMEAQQWLDAYDKFFMQEWENAVKDKTNELLKETLPAMRMMEFAPKYSSMSKTEQDVFESLVEGSEIKDSTGMVIGYDTDLDQAYARAVSIAKRFGSTQSSAPAAQKAAPSGPVMDLPSSGSSTAPKSEAPKNLNEALKAYRKGNK